MSSPTGAVLRVADELLRRIVADEYSPGLRLPAEVDLAAEFGCGRSTIREALRHLAGMNLVQSRRGSGAVVLDFRREGGLELMPVWFHVGRMEHPLPVIVVEMLRMRAALACEAARLAALYATPATLAPVRRLIERAESLVDKPVEHSLAELEIFRALTQASSIWPAAWLANAFIRPMREVHRMVAEPVDAVPADWPDVMAVLLGHVERRDAEGAVAHLGCHFERVDRKLTDSLQAIFAR
jgi:DNA-binding FadR family transcriptional regulator